ncbi:MAG TPA: anti-sigma factor [Gemmatimonadaceae bacterium]|jgi:anti-sigma-K factor RskA|nr:anti-sigma factor [Gemmatimonadaceae bacterium]
MTDDTRKDGGEHNSPADVVSSVDVAGAALGALSPVEEAALRGTAMWDDRVATELAEMEAVVAEFAWLAPTQQMNRGRSAGIRSRLVSRAAASRDGRTGAPRPMSDSAAATPRLGASLPTSSKLTETLASPGMSYPTARPLPRVYHRSFNWLALAAGIAFVVTGTALIRVVHERNRFRDAVAAQQSAMLSKVATMQSVMATKDSLITSLTGPQMRVVDLVTRTSQDPLARMFWDQKTQEWTMYAYHMRQPRAGKTFQVWLITSGSPKPISAGTFTPDANGSAIMHAKYPLDPGTLQKVAVSEEPMGGMPSPTGPIIVAGTGT